MNFRNNTYFFSSARYLDGNGVQNFWASKRFLKQMLLSSVSKSLHKGGSVHLFHPEKDRLYTNPLCPACHSGKSHSLDHFISCPAYPITLYARGQWLQSDLLASFTSSFLPSTILYLQQNHVRTSFARTPPLFLSSTILYLNLYPVRTSSARTCSLCLYLWLSQGL